MAVTLLQFPASAMMPTAAAGANQTAQNAMPVLSFSGSAANSAQTVPVAMPQAYASGTLTAYITGFCAATDGDLDWDVQVEANATDEDSDTDSYDTANSTDNTTDPAVALNQITIAVTLTNKDSVAAGERVRFKITRQAVDDTNTGIMYVTNLEIREG